VRRQVNAYQAVIVQIQDVHALSNLLVHSIQLSFNATQDARHLVSQTLLRHNLLQLIWPLHLSTQTALSDISYKTNCAMMSTVNFDQLLG